MFALADAFDEGSSLGLSIDDLLSILVHLQFDDLNVGWMDSDVDGGPVRLVTGDLVHVDYVLQAVHAEDL